MKHSTFAEHVHTFLATGPSQVTTRPTWWHFFQKVDTSLSLARSQAAQTLGVPWNKIRLTFQFWTKIEIELTYILFVFFYLLSFFASRAIWKQFYQRLRF